MTVLYCVDGGWGGGGTWHLPLQLKVLKVMGVLGSRVPELLSNVDVGSFLLLRPHSTTPFPNENPAGHHDLGPHFTTPFSLILQRAEFAGG